MNSDPAVLVEGLSVAADGQLLLREADFQARAGQLTALTGPSGAGKTTLLRALTGLLPPGATRTTGRVAVLGRDIFTSNDRELREFRRTRMAFVGQDPGSSLNPRMRVRTLIRELAADPTTIPALLAEVQLPTDPAFTARRPGALSGGQQRRVALARALARRPDLLLLDEPTAGLHPTLRDEIGDLLIHLARTRGLTIVFACHDTELVARIADEVVDLAPAPPRPAAPSGPVGLAERRAQPVAAGLSGHDADSILPERITPLASGSAASAHPDSSLTCPERTVGSGLVAEGAALAASARPVAGARRDAVGKPVEPAAVEGDSLPRVGRWAGASASGWQVESSVVEGNSLLTVRGLAVAFAGGGRVLHDVDLAVAAGAAVGIVGPSGSGKTSLVRAVVGLHPPSAGTVALDGAPLRAQVQRRNREQRRRIQLVPQNPLGALNPSRTVGSTLERPLRLHRRCGAHAVRDRVSELLRQVELEPGFAQRYPHELSGGQRQRVSIARALAAEPEVLICDEVTSALDGRTAEAIMELLCGLRDAHRLALVLIAHDLPLIADRTDTVAVLDAGRVVESGRTTSVFGAPRHAATRALLAGAAVPGR